MSACLYVYICIYVCTVYTPVYLFSFSCLYIVSFYDLLIREFVYVQHEMGILHLPDQLASSFSQAGSVGLEAQCCHSGLKGVDVGPVPVQKWANKGIMCVCDLLNIGVIYCV